MGRCCPPWVQIALAEGSVEGRSSRDGTFGLHFLMPCRLNDHQRGDCGAPFVMLADYLVPFYSMTTSLRNARRVLGAPVDIASLAFGRICFGLILVWEVTRYFDRGWIEDYWMEPEFHFSYFGFGWLVPWPGDGMYWHFVLIGVLAGLVVVGVCYRVAAVGLFLSLSYVFVLEQARYLNHFYLICLLAFLFAIVPAGSDASLDRRWKWCRPRSQVPLWCLGLLRFQIGAVYFFGGIAKLNGDWLAGEPLRMWLRNRTDYPLIGSCFESEWVVMGMVYGGLIFDLLVVPLLCCRRTRTLAFIGVVCFNGINAVLFSIGVFPWLAIAMSTLFFDPSWPRRYFVWSKHQATDGSPLERAPCSGMVLLFVTAYLTWQVFLPLRHWLYPGNVSWTEEGHLYAWHMKLRSKVGRARFQIVNRDTGLETNVRASEFVEIWQARRMATKPDMILQFAHFLGERLRRDGVTNVVIRVDSEVALNGRNAQRMIDPSVNLLEKPRSLWAKDWLMPLREPLRSHAR